MPVGKVKWFNNAKGFGFIVCDDHKEDLFAHFSTIEMEGYKTLKAGQDVEFETVKSERGIHAVNIQVVGATESTTETTPVAVQEPS
jgi:CspA family cold shock protein